MHCAGEADCNNVDLSCALMRISSDEEMSLFRLSSAGLRRK